MVEWDRPYRFEMDIHDKEVKVMEDYQIDEIGNIYQRQGGIIPKACQKCKKEFISEIREFPVTQKIPFYKCEDCDFENPSGDATLGHKIENMDHDIKKTVKDRIVTIEKRLVGNKANVKKTENDVIILCDNCLNG